MAINQYLINPIRELVKTGKLTGILLILATLCSLIISNTGLGSLYLGLWDTRVGFPFLNKSILHWINDGLMPLFFLLVGIEIKREFTKGELSDFRQAILPVGAAVGGILVPAALFFTLNAGNPANLSGWAIPTATDIAFSLGILSLLGNRIPFALKVFLVALANTAIPLSIDLGGNLLSTLSLGIIAGLTGVLILSGCQHCPEHET